MRQATLIWSLRQRLLRPFASAFTRPGHRRFVERVTALVLNAEEHTITRSVTAIERTADWEAIESFAEYGAWEPGGPARTLTQLIDEQPGRLRHGYRVSALDDTEVHRRGEHVRGTCTFHEDTARCPNRAATVRARNRVALGALLRNDGRPAWYLRVSGRLYSRESQLPERPKAPGSTEPFRAECELAAELLRQRARLVGGPHLGIFDGGYAPRDAVRPPVMPEDGSPRVEILTRLRHDARLCALPPTQRKKGQRGPMPKWGREPAPPRRGGRWPGTRQKGEAFIYGRMPKVRGKEVVCLRRVLGHDVTVKAVVAEVEGYKKRLTVVTPAVGLGGLQAVELFAARFRQEAGSRDLKQRLGWEGCRAWTGAPIGGTTQVQWATMSPLRLLRFRPDTGGSMDRWSPPPGNKKEERPSVRDVERLLRRHRPEIQRHLSSWLAEEEEAA